MATASSVKANKIGAKLGETHAFPVREESFLPVAGTTVSKSTGIIPDSSETALEVISDSGRNDGLRVHKNIFCSCAPARVNRAIAGRRNSGVAKPSHIDNILFAI
jgi:hypothetical protein